MADAGSRSGLREGPVWQGRTCSFALPFFAHAFVARELRLTIRDVALRRGSHPDIRIDQGNPVWGKDTLPILL